MKIALLGGAFNPPHIGHSIIASQVLDFTDAEQVWFLPSWKHSFHKPMASAEARLAMTRLVVTRGMSVSTIEIDRKLSGQTIELVRHLPQQHDYVFVIGSDQLPTFHLWGRWRELLDQMPFWVFPRYGYPLEPVHKNMTIITNELLICTDISSTKIRKRVLRGLGVGMFVHPQVEKYIMKNSLYTHTHHDGH